MSSAKKLDADAETLQQMVFAVRKQMVLSGITLDMIAAESKLPLAVVHNTLMANQKVKLEVAIKISKAVDRLK